MKKTLLSLAVTMMSLVGVAETINIQGTDYQTDVLIDRDLGPGVNYKRLRIPDFPLNVNMVTMDLTNPYNRIETTQGGEQLGKTEKLADAYKRQYSDEKRPLAGANGNFWVVTGQYHWAEFLVGATFNGNVRNGEIITETNAHADWWGHNNGSPGCVAITPDKEMVIDFMYYKGSVSNEKIGSLVIQQTNKVVRDNEVGLYNHFFGRTKSFIPADQYVLDGVQRMKRADGVSTEVYLKINEGHQWMVGRAMECTVQEVKTDAGSGTLGEYDLCLVGRGTNKEPLASLVAGDVVTIDLKWELPDGSAPEIEQLIGGNGVVMVDGVLTNLNEIDDYNTKTYSRCAYGTTADRKTMINVVIDMSNDPVYGKSAGCNTKVMCDIMSHYGCTNIMNMDAGGSAQMMVNGEVINKTTEGTPRAVANGWMLYSIAPQDNEIARLEFDEVTLQAPPYSTFTPKILGYNRYGDLIDEDVQGFTLTCAAELGTTSGSNFTAGGTAMTGDLTATLNGVSVSKPITIVDANLSLRIKPLLIDAVRKYPIEVTSSIGDNVYTYDPSHISWTIDDAGVASIDSDGILRGIKEGTATYIGSIGEFSDTTTVTVEIAGAPKLYPSDYTGWSGKGSSGITKVAMGDDGTIGFTYGSPRSNAYAQVSKEVRYYSIPDRLLLEFTPTVNITSVSVDLRGAQNVRANKVDILPSSGEYFAAGETHRVELPLSALGDPSDLILYPVTLHYIQFNIEVNSANKGAQGIRMSELSAEYSNYSGVDAVKSGTLPNTTVYPNPVTDGVFTVVSSVEIENVSVYSLTGIEMENVKGTGCSAMTVNVRHFPAGVYFARVSTAIGENAIKLIIK